MNPSDGARPWLAALQPFVQEELRVELKVPITMPAGRMIHDLPGVFMRFPKWSGAPFVDDFGKKSAAMVEIDGEHLFAELAVLRLLEKDGWSGRWVNTYGGGGEVWKYLTEWQDVPRADQRTRPIQDDEPRQLLAKVAGFNRPRRYKGCWDVFAWRGSDVAFLECKRTAPKYKDLISKEKEEWVRSSLYIGDTRLTTDSFCVVQWDYQ
jgi:hypothetical protein